MIIDHESEESGWISNRGGIILRLAAVYNLLWGGAVVLFPAWTLGLAGLGDLNHPPVWQAVGMIVGVYGIGYWIAAGDPVRHWPIILVGMLGKVLGPLGVAWGIWSGQLPTQILWTILFNDLIWWVPFALLLWQAAKFRMGGSEQNVQRPFTFAEAMTMPVGSTGETLDELSTRGPTLLVFLRHAGCTFCREAVVDLTRAKPELSRMGVQIAVVHLDSEEGGKRFLERFGLTGVASWSDPGRQIYRAFELRRGKFWQLFRPRVWWRGMQAAIFGRHGFGPLAGDATQMPGLFLLSQGRIVRSFRHSTAADRPDYVKFASGVEFPAVLDSRNPESRVCCDRLTGNPAGAIPARSRFDQDSGESGN